MIFLKVNTSFQKNHLLSMEISVNVFDMLPINKSLRFIHYGMYHSTIVLGNSKECYFVSGQSSFRCGIIVKTPTYPPKAVEGPFYKTYHLGLSNYTEEELLNILSFYQHSKSWLESSYNLFYHNCNTFTLDFCRRVLPPERFSLYPFFVSRLERSFQYVYSISLSHLLCSMNNFITQEPPNLRKEFTENDLLSDSLLESDYSTTDSI